MDVISVRPYYCFLSINHAMKRELNTNKKGCEDHLVGHGSQIIFQWKLLA
jgi:hypothetical protein|tara:strand:- start:3075 stop:3224 length:150 start_codon:yes stop_codon:yes gene_type:complete